MSAAIRKLEQLLSRVQSRRAEPREPTARATDARPQHVEPVQLKPEMMRVPPPSAAPVVPQESTLRESPQAGVDRTSRPAVITPLEDAMGQLAQPAPLNLSPTPVAAIPASRKAVQPAADDDLVLDDFDDGPPTIRPPEPFDSSQGRAVAKAEASRAEPVPVARVEVARPEVARVEVARPEEERPTRVAPVSPEVQARAEPVKPVRIATAEPLAASPVTTVSTARAFVPKTFGQLVERSLALRPRR